MDTSQRPAIPDHVPEDLIVEFNSRLYPGMNTCPHATLAKFSDGPRIVFNATADMRPQGAWMPTRAEDIRKILSNPTDFSARDAGGFAALIGEDWKLIPAEMDPPEHTEFRSILNPLFTRLEAEKMDGQIRMWCNQLIDNILNENACDFTTSFAQPFPVFIFLELMGLPRDKFDDFMTWADGLLHGDSMEARVQGCQNIADYLREFIEERKNQESDDIISHLLTSTVFGRNLTDDELLGTVFLLFGGGTDTVAASLGFFFKYLAENQAVQTELRDNPELIPNAVEEFLRSFSIVTSFRTVTRPLEFAGVDMKEGDAIMITSPFVSLDPDRNSDPLKIDIHRERIRHGAFSSGIHSCIGVSLARRELTIAIEECLRRLPAFTIDSNKETAINCGNLLGVAQLPIKWE